MNYITDEVENADPELDLFEQLEIEQFDLDQNIDEDVELEDTTD